MGVLYGKRDLLALLANQGHYFQGQNDFQRRLCPGGPNYELSAAAAGIGDYLDQVHERHYPGANVDTRMRLDQVFSLFADHETRMARDIEDFLTSKSDVRLVGQGATSNRERVSVFSFTVDGRDSREIPEALRNHNIGIHANDFYAARCIDALGARPQNGVVRVSLVHYNSGEDVERLFAGLDQVL
jgi:selenocysteine lyase/cysteine desulfurase